MTTSRSSTAGRSPVLVGFAFLALAAVSATAPAQQPNHPNATLSINGVAGGPYPMNLPGVPGSVVTVRISSALTGQTLPFALAYGRVLPGVATIPAGIVDLDFSICGFGLAFNGFDPTNPVWAISILGPPASPAFQATFAFPPNFTVPAGLQGAVADPTSPAGIRLTAAADFVPGVPVISFVTPGSGPATGGTVVTIEGDGFYCDQPQVTFGGVAATSVQVLSGSQIRCTTPAQGFTAPTPVTVTVTQAAGSGSLAAAFLYTPGNLITTITETFSDTLNLDTTFVPRFTTAGWNSGFQPGFLSGAPLVGSPLATYLGTGALGTRIQVTVAPPENFTFGLYSPFDSSANNLGPAVNPNGGSHIMHLYEGVDLGNLRSSLELVEWGPLNNAVFASVYPQYRAWCGMTSIAAPMGGGPFQGLIPIYRINYNLPTIQPADPGNLSAPGSTIGGVAVGGPQAYATAAAFTTYFPYPLLSPPFDYLGGGPGAGNLVFEQNVEPGALVSNFHRFRATAVAPARRLIGAPRSSGQPSAAAAGLDIYHLRFTFVTLEGSARSKFYDTGILAPAAPVFSALDLNPSPAVQPLGTRTLLEVEGADAIVSPSMPSGPTTGFLPYWNGDPLGGSFNPLALLNPGNPAAPQLSGRRFFRFRATLRGNNLTNAIPRYTDLTATVTF